MFINKKSENLTMSVFWQLLYVEPDPSLKVNNVYKRGGFFPVPENSPSRLCSGSERQKPNLLCSQSTTANAFPSPLVQSARLGRFLLPMTACKEAVV